MWIGIGLAIWFFWLSLIFAMIAGQFQLYMLLAAGKVWGWWADNFFEDVYDFLYNEVFSKWFLWILIFPTRTFIQLLLQLSNSQRAEEWQAFVTILVLYPLIFFFNLAQVGV